MLFQDVVNHGTLPALEKMLAYTQARHRMLTENIANVDTPGYKTQHLDTEQFQKSLREAIDTRKKTGSPDFIMKSTGEFTQDAYGRLNFSPSIEPAENLLFHDKTNMSIERQMAMLAENAMMHQAMTELLKGKFDGLMKAIRGRVS